MGQPVIVERSHRPFCNLLSFPTGRRSALCICPTWPPCHFTGSTKSSMEWYTTRGSSTGLTTPTAGYLASASVPLRARDSDMRSLSEISADQEQYVYMRSKEAVCLSIYMSAFLSVFLYVWLSLYLSICLLAVSVAVHSFVCVCLSIFLPICLSCYLSDFLHVCLSMCLYVGSFLCALCLLVRLCV